MKFLQKISLAGTIVFGLVWISSWFINYSDNMLNTFFYWDTLLMMIFAIDTISMLDFREAYNSKLDVLKKTTSDQIGMAVIVFISVIIRLVVFQWWLVFAYTVALVLVIIYFIGLSSIEKERKADEKKCGEIT